MSRIGRAPKLGDHESRRTIATAVSWAVAILLACASPLHAQQPVGATAVISWVAPGDDDFAGLASRYEMRYRMTALLTADTLTWWNAGTPVSGLPAPGPAGSVDSVVVNGLNPSTEYWFMLRVADEAPNWSGYSNIVIKPAFADVVRPAPIDDLDSATGNQARSPSDTQTEAQGPKPRPTPPR